MSWSDAKDAQCSPAEDCPPVELSIGAKAKDIGAFEVRRSLPVRQRRAIGPFVFFDEMGPAVLPAEVGMDVRPHPHINLATITYLYEGAIAHRDSLGTNVVIEPGAINLMVAGRGIVHSERSPASMRDPESRIHGLQLWIALPDEHEEDEPSFHHHPASTIPEWEEDGARVRLLVGEVGERRSPVRMFSEILYLSVDLEAGGRFQVPPSPERGLYIVDGEVELGGHIHGAGVMLVLREGVDVEVRSAGGARCALVGGASVGPRHMFWNFVSSRRDRLEEAKADWREERFPTVPGDDQERIPLPE